MEEKYINKLKKIQEEQKYDEEVRHGLEDELLCELLTELGYKKIVELYDSTDKWYA